MISICTLEGESAGPPWAPQNGHEASVFSAIPLNVIIGIIEVINKKNVKSQAVFSWISKKIT